MKLFLAVLFIGPAALAVYFKSFWWLLLYVVSALIVGL